MKKKKKIHCSSLKFYMFAYQKKHKKQTTAKMKVFTIHKSEKQFISRFYKEPYK